MRERITLANGQVQTGPCGFVQRVNYEGLSNSDLKTWLFEIRKLLDHPKWYTAAWRDNPRTQIGGPLAVVIEGKIPSRQEIDKMPGERACNFFTNSHSVVRVVKERAEESAA